MKSEDKKSLLIEGGFSWEKERAIPAYGMQNKGAFMKRRVWSFILICVLLMGVLATENGFAAAATVSLSGGGTYEKGDSFYVTLTYSGDTFGAATAKLTYDSSVLTFQSCSGAESYGSGGVVTVTMSNGSGTSSLSCRLKFTAKAAGSSYITAETSDVYNLDMEELSAQTKSIKVTVKNTAASASTNANLASLQVSGGTLSPAFSASTTSYTVKVPYEVTVCTVSARAADSDATFQVTGSKNLSVGSNVRSVIVTAESGRTKTYTIQIIRAGKDGETEEPDQEEKEEKPESIEVTVGDKKYLLVEDLTGITIPEGFSLCSVLYKDHEVSGITDGGDVIFCMLEEKENGEQKWFFYDGSNEKFSQTQRFTPEQIMELEKDKVVYRTENAASEEAETAGFWKNIDATTFMLLCLGGTAGILMVIVLIVLIRRRGRHK